MADTDFQKISREDLQKKLAGQPPSNNEPRAGYALVNVLKPESFEEERIPHSINIPAGRLDEFEKRFDKDKEIIVYCASPECDASPKAAKGLVDKGFRNVVEYAEGLSDWKRAGGATAGTSA